MFNSIRLYSRIGAKKYKKLPPVRMKKPKKNEGQPLPIFDYGTSSKDHRIYVWGLANHGGLGTAGRTRRKDGYNFIAKPSRLFFGEHHQVTDIACGYGFTLLGVNSKDKNIVYGNGINTDSQLGFDANDFKHKVTGQTGQLPLARPIPLPLKENSSKVLGLAAGRAHSLILTSEGVFTLGNNAYGQCGRSIIEEENHFESHVIFHIPEINGQKIAAVSAGQDHSIFLTEQGQVYACGWGADGQTGLGHYNNQWKPELVKGEVEGEKIIKVAGISDCVLALSESGKVYGWGNSEYGQLPVQTDNYQVNTAIELSDFSEFGHVVDVAAGGSFCMALTETGDVYTWGYGILGFGPRVTKVQMPTQIPNTLFGRNPYQPDIKVEKIYCGINYMCAVTNQGELYTWGRNAYGYLGLGHCKDQFFPLKVAMGAKVEKVACGVDHTVALCRAFI
ncbi:Similar to Rcc1l: RCC1-like G exchanging factor-like protein (Mus musculus) [Cotesia congregata]|uniref:Similar to Rcc1l: RCC1-like G exchanging factor-like protein (Mus musculus) n=1 Tax=Cotesia congregata TaxID=51543 RepID=A0A8J2HM32_COTCN|nr:Similar to Rcc1l: RCC1-like G exchanging factor-like protein (Mus musculus) [Cotesia congregata]